MMTKNVSKGLRWWVLIVALLNPFFDYIAKTAGLTRRSIGEVAMLYDNYFMPAGYAFSIWGVIYLSFIIYAIYQLLPSSQKAVVFDRLSTPFIAANLLGMLWQVLFSHKLLTLGTLIIISMLLLAISMFSIAGKAQTNESYGKWLSIPFSLYLGWLSVAVVANFTVLLTANGWQGDVQSQQTTAILLVSGLTGIALYLSLRLRDWIYPLVVTWALIALYFGSTYKDEKVAIHSIVSAALLSIYLVSFFIWKYLHPSHNGQTRWLKKHNNHILKH